jgi:hypothetical protein
MKQLTTVKFDSPTIEDDDDLGTTIPIAKSKSHNAIGVTPTRKKRKPKRDPRGYRWQLKFWLDSDKPDQLSLGKWLHEQKRARKFAPLVRNALALYRELLDGKTDLLYELFPHLKPAAPPPVDEEMRKRLALLERVVLTQNSTGAPSNTIKMLTANGPKAVAIATVHDDEDDKLVAVKDKNAGAKSAQNFIQSAFALQGITLQP